METDCTYLGYAQTNSFSALVNDYLDGNEKLSPFYQFSPDWDGIQHAVKERTNFPVNRKSLVDVLRKQYATLPENETVNANIEALLQENTFTICTAHQPNLLTGYLYFFYKILHAIKVAEQLNEQFPDQKFVPVYYMGSEDNDLDELGQFRYENEKFVWDGDGQTGAVGRMKTKSLKALLNKLFQRMGPPGKHYDELSQLLSEAYLKHDNIAAATQYLVHQLFGQYGLIILNPDEAILKGLFSAIIENDLFKHDALPLATQQSELLAKDYKAQAFPREINLFYLKDNIRSRIEIEGDKWKVLDTELEFSEQEMREELRNFPDRFSPNVILRGLFQETILPDVCFIGGGSELAYWLQLKPVFEHFKVFYPVIYLRQSVQILNNESWRLMQLLHLDVGDIFESEQQIIKQWIVKFKGESWNINAEKKQLEALIQSLLNRSTSIDVTLEKAALSVLEKVKKQVHALEQKMYRAEKRKEQITVDRVKKMKSEAFPGAGLQERYENFIPYYLQHGFEVFDLIKNKIEPFNNSFLVVHPKK